MKIVIVGGHMAPALAVMEALSKDTEILYIGRKHALEGDQALSLEYQKITSLKIPFVNLETGRLQRRLTKQTIPSLMKLPAGFVRAFRILKDYKPDVVVGFGGYLQIPICLAAFFLGIPVVLHEQTLRAGLANKIIAPIAEIICISWEDSAKYFPKSKTVLTGIPIRKEFLHPITARRHDEAISSIMGAPRSLLVTRNDKIIYITGGSLGAHAVNQLIEGSIEKLLGKFYVYHQTGGATEYNDYERLEKIKNNLPEHLQKKYKLVKFVNPQDTASIMREADLVVSRAGMNTIAELIYLEKPCLLIPLPHGQANEQLENARLAVRLGLGKVLKQEELTPEILYSQIVEFTAKLDKVGKSGDIARNLIKHEAANKIVEAINKIYQEYQK